MSQNLITSMYRLQAKHASAARSDVFARVVLVVIFDGRAIAGESSSEQLNFISMHREQGFPPSHRARDRRHGTQPSIHLSGANPFLTQPRECTENTLKAIRYTTRSVHMMENGRIGHQRT